MKESEVRNRTQESTCPIISGFIKVDSLKIFNILFLGFVKYGLSCHFCMQKYYHYIENSYISITLPDSIGNKVLNVIRMMVRSWSHFQMIIPSNFTQTLTSKALYVTSKHVRHRRNRKIPLTFCVGVSVRRHRTITIFCPKSQTTKLLQHSK